MSSVKASYRPTKEGPLLILAIALVCTICIPLWQWSSSKGTGSFPLRFTPERAQRLLLGPEQIACYCCFVWGAFILGSRFREVRRQRKTFGMELLPSEEDLRILPEDSRPLLRKTEQLTSRGGPYILSNMIKTALTKYSITRNGRDVADAVRGQADVELGRLISSMSTVHFLAWAIPALGFLGTVRGLGMSLAAPDGGALTGAGLQQATSHLTFAFDTTLVALALSLPLMFLLQKVQRDEEALVLDCQSYCQEKLVGRLYNPEISQERVEQPVY